MTEQVIRTSRKTPEVSYIAENCSKQNLSVSLSLLEIRYNIRNFELSLGGCEANYSRKQSIAVDILLNA